MTKKFYNPNNYCKGFSNMRHAKFIKSTIELALFAPTSLIYLKEIGSM